MNEKKLFDLLENAENDSMNRLIDKCPEISDKQLDRILAKSEKKFKKMEKEYDRNNRNITMTENDTVEGVEHSRRPAWLSTLSMAASVVLIAGIVIGSTALLNRNGNPFNGEDSLPPSATDATSDSTDTLIVSSVMTGTGTDGTAATAVSTDTTTEAATEDTTEDATEETTEGAAKLLDIRDIAGEWTYQESSGNYTVDKGARNIAQVDINSDGTYTYIDSAGKVTNGRIEFSTEKIMETEFINVNFYSGSERQFSATYRKESKDEMYIGNGGLARLVRGKLPLSKDTPASKADITDITGTWTYQESDGNYTVDRGAKNIAAITVNSNWSYTYTDAEGNTSYGTVVKNAEELNGVDMPYFSFYQNGADCIFSVLYVAERPDEMYIGNGGMARLIRGSYALDSSGDSPLDIRTLAGKWTYQESNGNNSVVVDPVDVGTITVNADGTYSYTDTEGNTSTGTVKTGYEEIGGTKMPTVNFYKNGSFYLGGYYDDAHPDEIYLGNGGMARIVRAG